MDGGEAAAASSVDGGTESIRAAMFDVKGNMLGQFAAPYETRHPHPGWAEQDPDEWWQSMGKAALCVDTTCCTVVALDDHKKPLRPALLWMDCRAAEQASEILSRCKDYEKENGITKSLIAVNCDGNGPISAEWMLPKALWIKAKEPEVWKKSSTICEYQDFINLKLTGTLCVSSCNAAARWHWNGREAVEKADGTGGRPLELLRAIDLEDLQEKWPTRCLAMGQVIGKITKAAADHLQLAEHVDIVQGGPDAFVGMVGLGCVAPGLLGLITGSSHLHVAVTSEARTAKNMWGAYVGAPLPGLCFVEGGQSSTGSVMRWSKSLISGKDEEGMEYKDYDLMAANVSVGCDGLVALETFQGSRTPTTDPTARGALVGLTLSHRKQHVWRAFLESVCYGTRACIDGLSSAGVEFREIKMAGGVTRSQLWLQMHADVTGLPVVSPLLLLPFKRA
ncbi:hypothetical protein GUITHDRAFT_158505 [Guillardia theta CCMP2712]|uniref:Glycerol kinase n=1 Tax=Guillardia theta (strain CCMP2712) TaxID=905079 RepID=L1IQK8_GUITC|nr:hypothetical protein GUITHDRAFT_158505 [Guillardia theta CCMP2712]EKX38347.1 hypothetical protein GUITHDRAFT_158505 [Guillardia theta CCMP2712]|eukprot:XP_005825327.1 hypothetical protein GUITHDRAFT_158505 [Guillardia theta CCMP2712]